MPFCNKCGNEIAENVNFCPKCGGNQQGGQNPAQSTEGKPTLWGPIAACILSIFLPPLGVFLHYSNWKTLKQERKAKTSLIWFICLIVSLLLAYLSFFKLSPLPIILLIVWYIVSARSQIKYIKEKYGTEYNKKSLLIPVIIVIVVDLSICIISTITVQKRFGSTTKLKAQELVITASTWSKMQQEYIKESTWSNLQQAYIIEEGRVGDCSQIGYTAPDYSKSFTYKCGVQNGIAIWTAENKEDLGECKAGNQWVINMNRYSEIMLKQPDDKKCAALTPDFCNLATSGKCVNMQEERAKEEDAEKEKKRALAEKEAEEKIQADNMRNATAELEQEAKKWQGSFNDDGSNSYKATEGDFFKFNSKNSDSGPDIIWTATSKVNIGDCPANSVWKMLNACEGMCYWSNQVPSKCEPITPKTISSYSGSDGDEDGYH